MSDAATTTFGLTCGCGNTLHVEVPAVNGAPENVAAYNEQVAMARHRVTVEGWLTGDYLEQDSAGHSSFFAYCSLDCHNNRARDLWESNNDERWWIRNEGGEGPKPRCTCPLEQLSDGRLVERRVDDCPWHTWLDARRERLNRESLTLYEKWKNVPIGTSVREHGRGHRKGRGVGVVSGAAKVLTYGSRMHYALIPVDDWAPHPELRDLEIVLS